MILLREVIRTVTWLFSVQEIASGDDRDTLVVSVVMQRFFTKHKKIGAWKAIILKDYSLFLVFEKPGSSGISVAR